MKIARKLKSPLTSECMGGGSLGVTEPPSRPLTPPPSFGGHSFEEEGKKGTQGDRECDALTTRVFFLTVNFEDVCL